MRFNVRETLGYFFNYRARDNIEGLKRTLNKEPRSVFNKFRKIIVKSFLTSKAKYNPVRSETTTPLQKNIPRYDIHVDKNSKPYLRQVNNEAQDTDQDLLLPIPHSQQTSPNGCADACLDMLGQYFDIEELKANVKVRSDGLRLMPKTKRPIFEGITDFSAKLTQHDLTVTDIRQEKEVIKKALKYGPIVASVEFAHGIIPNVAHSIMIVGYHEDSVIINDPWGGGHLVKSMDWLLKNLRTNDDALQLITKKN